MDKKFRFLDLACQQFRLFDNVGPVEHLHRTNDFTNISLVTAYSFPVSANSSLTKRATSASGIVYLLTEIRQFKTDLDAFAWRHSLGKLDFELI